MKGLYICSFPANGTNSYFVDWENAFIQAGFDSINVIECDKHPLSILAMPWKYDIIVLGHSCYYNLTSRFKQLLAIYLKMFRGTVIGFLQNEFRNFKPKIDYFEGFGTDLLVSQFPKDIALEFYSGRTSSAIIGISHGMNSQKIRPFKEHKHREIDVGSRFTKYANYLGNVARAETLPNFISKISELGELNLDWETDSTKRFKYEEWQSFLENCRTTASCESGGPFLQWSEQIRTLSNNYEMKNPEVSFQKIYDLFMKNSSAYLSGQVISPRHFDAIAAGTCQILTKGRYSDVLVAGEHYIELDEDMSNFQEVYEQIADSELTEKIARNALKHSLENHTLQHRVKDIIDCAGQLGA